MNLLGRCLAASCGLSLLIAVGCEPLAWAWVPWVALVPWLRALDGLDKRRAVLVGWTSGVAVILTTFPWVIGALSDYGDLPVGLGTLIYLLYALVLGAQFGLVALLDYGIRRVAPAARCLLLPAAFVVVERLWPQVFNWNLGTPLATNGVVSQVVDLTGPFGLTVLVVLANGALDALLQAARGRRPFPAVTLAIALAAVAFAVAYGHGRRAGIEAVLRDAPTAPVAWVQPNAVMTHLPDDDSELTVWNAMLTAAEQVAGLEKRFTVFGESSLPWPLIEALPLPDDADAAMHDEQRELLEEAGHRLERLHDLAVVTSGTALVGTTVRRIQVVGDEQWTVVNRLNSIVVSTLDADPQRRARYSKKHLVLFGEYLPLERHLPFLRRWFPTAGDYLEGTEPRLMQVGGLTIAPQVCYEGSWPRDVRAVFREGDPDLFVNSTNDLWFGRRQGPYLHRMVTVLRAIETRRPLLRVTVTGITTTVLPDGRQVNVVGVGEVGAGVSHVPLIRDRIPLTVYVRYGDWVLWLALLVLAGVGIRARRQR